MDLSGLHALLSRAAASRVAVVVDLMLDRYVYGEAERILPEATVPVLKPSHEVEMLACPSWWIPKGRDFARYGEVDLLKPNASELAAATGLRVGTDAETELSPARAILVTRGAAGASLARRNQDVLHVPARRRAVYDVSGAGDTFLAPLGTALAVNENLQDAVALGGSSVWRSGLKA